MDDPHPLMRAGQQAYVAGDPRRAREFFASASAELSGEQRIVALVNQASMDDALGDSHGAIASYQKALAAMPPDAGRIRPAALVNLSQALQNIGDLTGAQRALEQARDILAAGPGEADRHGERAEQFAELQLACTLSLSAVAVHRQQWPEAIELATESLTMAIASVPQRAGYALANLAAANFGIGRWGLAHDFYTQALEAFTAASDHAERANTQYNLALLLVRTSRLGEAEPLLAQCLAWFTAAGMPVPAARGLKALGIIADARQQPELAQQYYMQSLQQFAAGGNSLELASVQALLSTHAFAAGAVDQGEALLHSAFDTSIQFGQPAAAAQVDYWHAFCLEALLDENPELLSRAIELAVPAALALDAGRAGLGNGHQRSHWSRNVAGPAMRLAFRLAARYGDGGELLADLVETQCAGTSFVAPESEAPATATEAALDLLSSQPDPQPAQPGPLQLGAALAATTADAGVAVAPPPQLELPGRLVLRSHIQMAECRYGQPVRDPLVLAADE